MGFQDVAFMSSQASFPPHFLNTVVEVEALGPPHVLKLWLWLSKGILPVKYFCSNNVCLVSVEFNEDHKTVKKLR